MDIEKEGKMLDVPILSLKNVGFKPNNQSILENVYFDINKGENIILTGPSGSGKSTLLQLIGSIFTPSEGEVFYEGTSIKELEPTEYRKKVSYFFQNALLFDETVEDNLSFPYKIREKEFSEEKAKEYLGYVKLSASYLNKPVNELSGGEKQRVALIRNLLFQPRVLLLDEVTSSLDEDNRKIINEMIHSMNREENITILMITHHQSEILEADRVVQIKSGRVEGAK